MSARWNSLLSWRPAYSVLVLLLAWEAASRLALVNPYFLPPPSVLAQRAYHVLLEGELLKHMGATLWRALASLALCIVVSVPLGVAMARIRAVRRRDVAVRTEEPPTDVVVLSAGPSGLTFSASGGWLRRGTAEVTLTAMEFRLLVELTRHLGQMLSRPQLLERVWGYQTSGDDRLVDVTVRRLRVKLENDPSQPELLVTVRGLGYRLQAAT